ncbi:GyrI-like domain-containing protein [Agrococcus jejuensis]|uniref:GyrI-like small molecule binding domain-containing protein n=1 Tax=Agrococcus jejuensis TaxID=399736 RepID=A0A1G8GL80_9MICO|nr:GyrI-like domain-containing protein [Agrococcus jejuensis]SDH95164.1 GyrI-like small molecule binding domain-containing protein [Agrococcus jejuensis]
MADIDIRPLPAMRIAAATDVVPVDAVAGVVEALFQEVQAVFGHAPGAQDVPIATYAFDGDRMRVAAGYLVGMLVPEGLEDVELDAEEQVATLEHHGPMAGVTATWEALHGAIAERGLVPSGVARERYVRAASADQADWIVELQQPVRPA